MSGLMAKVYNASLTLQQQLNELTVGQSLAVTSTCMLWMGINHKLFKFLCINRMKKCNHPP